MVGGWIEEESEDGVTCDAHVLALVVKDAVILYHKSIRRIRSVIKYVTGSPSRLAKFKECDDLEKIDCKKMVFLYVKTRWNATYLMLEASIPYEKVFKRLEREQKNFRHKYISKESECEVLPNTDDDTIVIDSEDYFLSSSESECEGDLALIHEQLVRLRAIVNRDYDISWMEEVMFKKVGTVLKAVKQDMGQLYEEYNTMYSNTNADEGTGSKTAAGVDAWNFDILAWWQANSTKYKVLSLMAKDILVIPVSSVASESPFSTGKRILTP
ncbi:zinc finger BED domain-containing protein RICESLEEPER 1-like [Papaver somniferum]|uniref:zinc finger BED domain-containing protein RICESLEEPER 1-like n=1 Tax=Papaver somniferum TaxID=3469 RepID=UPI000E6F93C3|nr:zinc finger BED domain-containing protein RICESLEEPER 1-like [Papaver somniferum]